MITNGMKWMQKYSTLITEIISILFILLFVYAAVSKLVDFANFQAQLGQSPMLTYFAKSISFLVPGAELLLSIGLAFNRYRLIAFYGVLGLMSAFTMYIITILNFSDYIPCSCGGILENMGWTTHLIFNMLFVVLAIIGILLISQPYNPPALSYQIDER